MTINLGDKAKDSVSGFAGIVTARYEYMNGCVRMELSPDKLSKDGDIIDGRTFDLEQLELVKAAKRRILAPVGGPHLGDKAKDSISGFVGIVTGRYEYLNGCVRMELSPDKLNKDGDVIDARTFDVEQLELVKAAKRRILAPAGGPRPDPPPRSAPSR